MDKKNIENLKKGKATIEDFPFSKVREEELDIMMGKEENKRLFKDELEFNREVQLFVLNQANKRKLTSNFVVGTLFKLAWGILKDDFQAQLRLMDKYAKGGK